MRHVGKQRQPEHPNALGWRCIIVSVLASIVLSLVCALLFDTVVKQVRLMVPGNPTPEEQAAFKAGHDAWRSDQQINNVLAELNILAKRSPTAEELNMWAAADRSNSLPILAALLVELRSAGISAGARSTQSQPASSQAATADLPAEVDGRIRELLTSLDAGPPLQLHLMRMWDKFNGVLSKRRIDVRRAYSVFEFERWSPALSAYRPVLRELTDRLVGLGNRYRQLNRPADAALAYATAVRVLTDCVKDSPWPDVALFAADRLPVVLRALEAIRPTQSAATASTSPTAVAKNLERFHSKWMEVSDDDISLLPISLGPALIKNTQRTVLSFMFSSTMRLAFGCIAAIICLAQVVVILLTRCYGPVPLAWRWNRGTTTVVLVSMLFFISFLPGIITAYVPFIWLFSAPSLPAILLMPLFFVMFVVVAIRVFITFTEPAGRPALPAMAIIYGLLFVLLVCGITAGWIANHTEAWRPPLSVLVFRGIGVWGGIVCGLTMTVWAIWGWILRRKLSLRPGLRAQGNLAISALVMAGFLLLAAMSLFENGMFDGAQRTVLGSNLSVINRKYGYPICDRLGPDWFKEYFQPARNIVDSWQH